LSRSELIRNRYFDSRTAYSPRLPKRHANLGRCCVLAIANQRILSSSPRIASFRAFPKVEASRSRPPSAPQHCHADASDALISHTDRCRRPLGKIDDATTDIRSPIIDDDIDRTPVSQMRDAHARSKWQRLVSSRHSAGIEATTGSQRLWVRIIRSRTYLLRFREYWGAIAMVIGLAYRRVVRLSAAVICFDAGCGGNRSSDERSEDERSR